MDDHERVAWRSIRDAADEDALAFLCGQDTMVTEAVLRAALAAHHQWPGGLLGMAELHGQRSRQTSDREWRVGHDRAQAAYLARFEQAEAVIRSALACLPHADGEATAATVVAAARERGGRYGADEVWLQRAALDMEGYGEATGLRLVCRELLDVGRREEANDRRWLRRGIIAPHEMSDAVVRALRPMWTAATTDEHRAEVAGVLESGAVNALETGDFHDLYSAVRAQQVVVGRPFATWLQTLVDQALAADVQRELEQTC
ncbi:MAG: hypothetical protein QM572_08810 [Nocardioides sp.]|uniref:hypothetical protein n=1 Tax=Nocardioides sp. TaxID=35761 RepID=UPI0039E45D8D